MPDTAAKRAAVKRALEGVTERRTKPASVAHQLGRKPAITVSHGAAGSKGTSAGARRRRASAKEAEEYFAEQRKKPSTGRIMRGEVRPGAGPARKGQRFKDRNY